MRLVWFFGNFLKGDGCWNLDGKIDKYSKFRSVRVKNLLKNELFLSRAP